MVDPISIIKKHYQSDSDAFKILVIHSQQVRDKALLIAKQHPELNMDTDFISEAAMLHDIGVIYCDAPGINCHGTHQYIEHGYLGAELLRAEGLDAHALVSERHTGVGISLETIQTKNLPIPMRDMLPLSMEEKLICYADKFYSKTKLDEPHSIKHIRKKMKRLGDINLATFDSWHLIFNTEKHISEETAIE